MSVMSARTQSQPLEMVAPLFQNDEPHQFLAKRRRFEDSVTDLHTGTKKHTSIVPVFQYDTGIPEASDY